MKKIVFFQKPITGKSNIGLVSKKQKRKCDMEFFIFLTSFIYRLSLQFGSFGFEQVLFNLFNTSESVSYGVLWSTLAPKVMYSVIVVLFYRLITSPLMWKKEKPFPSNRVFIKNKQALGLVLVIGYLALSVKYFRISEYVYQQFTDSLFIEEHFVDPEEYEFEFPEQKQNLIFIFLESLESSFALEQDGGMSEINLLPELTQLCQENLYFSDTESKLGLGFEASGASWTVGSMVASTAGIPLKSEFGSNMYSLSSGYFNGLTNIGDILEEAGYDQYLIMGSEVAYGGREYYFKEHGNYIMSDYKVALETGKIPPGYRVNWGYEDEKLFEFAKEELTEISKSDTPFNYTMLTVDTHFPDGYICRLCEDTHGETIENVVACSDKQVSDFVRWIQEQDFYENTTIILLADHFYMENKYFTSKSIAYGQRRLFHCIINPLVDYGAVDTQRMITNLDFFPTTLAALGVTWESDRLGLGTNLFSDTPTLIEEVGISKLNIEISLKSLFYNEKFLS